MDNEHSVRAEVMDAIARGKVHMRPRWHFLLVSMLALVGTLIVLLTLVYAVSLGLFFLRDSGVWFAPSFGARGWWALVRATPWVLMLCAAAFLIILETLVRRYRFVYRRSLLTSLLVALLIVFLGGFTVSQTSLHRQLALSARRGELSPAMGFWYRGPFRMPRPNDAYHGKIVAMTTNGFVMFDEDDAGTTTVLLTPRTRFPYGADFSPGDRVVVIGDSVATGTVRAFGVRDIDQ